MNRRINKLLVLLVALTGGMAHASERPNVVFILADDVGWMDLASYAARVRGVDRSKCYYETPNLDRLAEQGMSFSQAYCLRTVLARARLGSDGTIFGATRVPYGFGSHEGQLLFAQNDAAEGLPYPRQERE